MGGFDHRRCMRWHLPLGEARARLLHPARGGGLENRAGCLILLAIPNNLAAARWTALLFVVFVQSALGLHACLADTPRTVLHIICTAQLVACTACPKHEDGGCR